MLLLLLLPLLLPLLLLLHRAFCLSSVLSRMHPRIWAAATRYSQRPDPGPFTELPHSRPTHGTRLHLCAGVACASPMSYCKHLH
jgi:hypothetical protein